MSVQIEIATKAIPVLHQYTGKLITLVDTILSTEVKCEIDKDHFGFMARCYLGEQRNYLEAIRQLVPSGLGRSAGLIARSMVEGLALLRWAAREPSRPLQWRTYALVVDWRLMKREESAGQQVETARKARIEQDISQYGGQFLSPRAIEKKKHGKPLPKDPYVREWYAPSSVWDIFKEVKGKALYECIYRSESERTHWSVASLGQNVFRSEEFVSYAGDSSPEDSATVLAVGFQALIETLEDVADHLNLARKVEIHRHLEFANRHRHAGY